MNRIFTLILFSVLSTYVSGNVCVNPAIKSTTYTTTDGMVISNVAFIAEFSVSCENGVKDFSLYADVSGKTVPAIKSLDGSKYQVSWTEDAAKVSSGDYPIRIYDDEGFAALRKAQRSGESTMNIQPLFTVTVNHAGTYLGPWVQSEFVAVAAALLLWYFAYSAKSKLQA